ncbi:class II fructose-bisphosphatase [Bacillus taeanensis]|uniref:Fructose-1,6-bisphosphatase n=1 Tax=Bacillus taeanensis TaxID=273032 RepID=A0A366XQJ3_9BACI|nr:class II fructose-bisphosphatase [Bacillus taeanensis]RBW68197.1 class II fructose-bisphosphatase [Bacillus taeanensis]
MDHLLFDFLSVTEYAAVASMPWVGRGQKNEADAAATTAMRSRLNALDINAVVVIGEGELDEAPMLYIGEEVGTKNGPKLDIAVDPLDGTNLIASGQGNSISVIAAASRGSLLHAPDMYMKKIAVGRNAAGKINIDAPLLENMKIVAEANGKKVSDLTVMVQDRERHKKIIKEVQEAGARICLFSDVDVTCAIATAIEGTGIDMFVGIGGAPEGVVSAVALKCLGGELQGQLLPNNDDEYNRCLKMGISNPEVSLKMDDLVKSNQCFFSATGITEGALLRGVRNKNKDKVSTHSLFTYGNAGRAYFIESTHDKVELAEKV